MEQAEHHPSHDAQRGAIALITLRSDPLRIYFNLCIIKYFLNTISPGNDMKEKVQTLLTSFSEVDVSAMGFPAGWEEEPLWK